MANNFGVPFYTPNPVLTGLSISYRNGLYIADQVCPRVPVGLPNFAYLKYNKADLFTVPDTRVSRTGLVNQVSYSSSSATASVEDHALEELVPRLDQVMAAAYRSYGTPLPDPMVTATLQVTELMDLAHEARVAALFANASNYASTNVTTLTGAAQWSAAGSNPITALLAAIEFMTFQSVAPNKLIISQQVWNVLKVQPTLLVARYGQLSGGAVVEADWLAGVIGVDEIIVGTSKANASKPGQSVIWQPLWGKFAALVYQGPGNSLQEATFALTAQFGARETADHFDIDRGRRGSDVVRVGEAHKELVIAPDYGYLFQNVIA